MFKWGLLCAILSPRVGVPSTPCAGSGIEGEGMPSTGDKRAASTMKVY